MPLGSTDEFGQTIKTEYSDPLLRPKRVYGYNFSAPEVATNYDDTNLTVTVTKPVGESGTDEVKTYLDSLGRVIKTQAKDSPGDVYVETHYDSLGRVDRVTNPYRIGDTIYWTKTRYDELGRAVETYAPAELANLGSAQSLGVTSYGISTVPGFVGTVVTTTDASGRQGRSITNALGQLIRVDEPVGLTGAGDLGPMSAPSQPTVYAYDLYGNMVHVQQGSQNRYFKYDSLGGLIRVNQPEQDYNPNLTLADSFNPTGLWTAGFAYDVLGNVVRATDANGVNIINDYDRAGRVKKRCYTKPNFYTTATTCAQVAQGDLNSETPTVNFYYDGKGLAQPQSPNYAKGKLTKVDNGISATENMTYNNLGRLTRSRQITDGVVYGDDANPMTYDYTLAGALKEERYPSGRIVRNDFETDGDLLNVTSAKTPNAVFATYVSDFLYTASGGIKQMKLGNGLWETTQFNTRNQVEELGLGSSPTDTGLWKINYSYGEIDDNGNYDPTKNTGNIAKQTLSFSGLAAPFIQAYKYDPLYRLKEAKETTNGGQNWIQNWTYDRYGNRSSFTQNIGGNTTALNPSVDQLRNRFTGSDFIYDKNGNVTRDRDGITNQLRTFVFNADNKQTEVKDANNVTIGQYVYDGEGKRVKKVITATGETTIFVYSAGKLIGEYSTASLPPVGKINYTTTDHLGSPRVITDHSGQVTSRRDFLPFGEDIPTGIGGRTGDGGHGYSSANDKIRQKFTGYQKDTETSLDFAEARMYENRFGRFTAVDPLLASGKSANPQTFNRYGYVLNNPLVMADPDGEKPIYVVKHGKPGYASWYWVESTSKSYDALKRKGYEDYKGPMGEIIHSHGKYYQLTDSGFQEAKPPTNSGEKRFDSGNNPFVGLNVFGSAFDNVVPFGQQLRHRLGIDIVDENSKEYNNFGTAATLVQLPFLVKSLPSLGSKILNKADDGIELGSAMFRTADDAIESGNCVVYQGFDGDIVKYVGITRRDPLIRFGEHKYAIGTGKELLQYRVVPGLSNLTRSQARVLEQSLINQVGLRRAGGTLLNRRNEIAPRYWTGLGIRPN